MDSYSYIYLYTYVHIYIALFHYIYNMFYIHIYSHMFMFNSMLVFSTDMFVLTNIAATPRKIGARASHAHQLSTKTIMSMSLVCAPTCWRIRRGWRTRPCWRTRIRTIQMGCNVIWRHGNKNCILTKNGKKRKRIQNQLKINQKAINIYNIYIYIYIYIYIIC